MSLHKRHRLRRLHHGDLWVERGVFFVFGIVAGVVFCVALAPASVSHDIELTPNPIEIPARAYNAGFNLEFR